jgi:DNA helicase-2/ATP-dependent DNA helicase PcrA
MITLWSIEKAEGYEREWRDRFVRQLLEDFRGLDTACDINLHLAFGIDCSGAEIDLLAATPGGIFIGEMKHAEGTLLGSMNSPWMEETSHQIREWNRRENPWEQVKRYRSKIVSMIWNSRFKVFKTDRPSDLCRAGLVQVPRLSLKFRFEEPWWYACGGHDWLRYILSSGNSGSINGEQFGKWLESIGCKKYSLNEAAEFLRIRLVSPKKNSSIHGYEPASSLDEHQLNATVAPTDRPTCVIAGPGSGKTRLVAERTRFLIESFPDAEDWIAVVSYTNAAADEIRSRLSLPEELGKKVFVGTFHGFALELLRRNEEASAPERMLDPVSARWRLSRLLGMRGDERSRRILALANSKGDSLRQDDKDVWNRFIEHLRCHRVATYESLLEDALLLAKNGNGNLPRALVYDEFQDVTPRQAELVELLIRSKKHVSVVGDPEQSIYAFNGCGPASLDGFRFRYPDSSYYPLSNNYRSLPAIVDLCNALRIRGDDGFKLKAVNDVETGVWEARLYSCDRKQAAGVARWVKDLRDGGSQYGGIAVLFAEWRSVDHVAQALQAIGIPFVTQDSAQRLPRSVRELLAWFHLSGHENSPERLLQLLECRPDVGTGFVERILSLENEVGVAGLLGIRTRLEPRYYRELESVALTAATVLGSVHCDPSSELSWLWINIVEPNLSVEEKRRLADIGEIVQRLIRYAGKASEQALHRLQQGNIGGITPEDANGDLLEGGAVTLVTIHGAKGKEWESVVVVDICDTVYGDASKGRDSAENLRMLHVACSRASRRLLLCFPSRIGPEIDGGIFREKFENLTSRTVSIGSNKLGL